MLDKNYIVEITNRDSGSAGYTIAEMNNLHRQFAAGETKEITMEELRALTYLPGGMQILQDCFVIHDEEAIAEIFGEVEPEYAYDEEDVKTLLTTGTNDQLEDCLDFAPEGVISLVKKIAVETKLNDVAKRKIIQEKTGFNVDRAIDANEYTKEENAKETKSERRAKPVSKKAETAKTRKTDLPSLKDLKKDK